jgi:hypothetical protein
MWSLSVTYKYFSCFITNFQNLVASYKYILKVNSYIYNCLMIYIGFVNFDFLNFGLFKTSHALTEIKFYFYCIYHPLNYVNYFSVQNNLSFCKGTSSKCVKWQFSNCSVILLRKSRNSFPRTQCVFMVKETIIVLLLHCDMYYNLYTTCGPTITINYQ